MIDTIFSTTAARLPSNLKIIIIEETDMLLQEWVQSAKEPTTPTTNAYRYY